MASSAYRSSRLNAFSVVAVTIPSSRQDFIRKISPSSNSEHGVIDEVATGCRSLSTNWTAQRLWNRKEWNFEQFVGDFVFDGVDAPVLGEEEVEQVRPVSVLAKWCVW